MCWHSMRNFYEGEVAGSSRHPKTTKHWKTDIDGEDAWVGKTAEPAREHVRHVGFHVMLGDTTTMQVKSYQEQIRGM